MKPLLVDRCSIVLFCLFPLSTAMSPEAAASASPGLSTAVGALKSAEASPMDMFSVEKLMAAVNSNQSLELFEQIAGTKLDSDSFSDVVGKVVDTAEKSAAKADESKRCSTNLSGKEEQLLASLHKAIADGKVLAQSALGNKFRAECKTAGMTAAEIKKYRLEWANDIATQLEAKKTHTKTWKRVDTTQFVYRPFGALVQWLGGWQDPAAIRGAATGAIQCLLLGPPYCREHPQTKMMNFAVAELSWKEEFEVSWQQAISYYTTDHDGARPGAPGPRPGAPGGSDGLAVPTGRVAKNSTKRVLADATTETATTTPSKKSSKVQQSQAQSDAEPSISPPGSARGSAGGSGGGSGDSEKARMADLFRKCVKVKTSYSAVTARADEILREIGVPKDRFSWAVNNDQGDRMIKNQLSALKNQVSAFGREVLRVKNPMDLKKTYDQSRLVVELTTFATLAEKIDKLSEMCDGFVSMGQVMQSMIQS